MKADLTSRYRGVRVALFGCSGFIGPWVAKRLIEEGALVTCFARTPNVAAQKLALYGVDAPVLPGAVDNRAYIAQALESLNPDVTFNLAAYGVNPGDQDPQLARSVNADFPEWLAHTLGAGETAWQGNRLVHVGTQYEYGRVTDFHEDGATKPVTLYGESKLAGTEGVLAACSETGLSAVTARIFNVFGPGEGDHRLLPMLIRAASDKMPIDLTSGEQKRDFCVVHDVAEGLLRLGAAEPLAGDPVNLASGRSERVRDFIEEAAHQLQIDLTLLRFGARPDRPQEVLDPNVSVDRLRHVTGWLPETPVAEGIRRTVAFVPQVP